MSVTRYAGLDPGIPWIGTRPGGGMDGKTPELNAIIDAAAKAMDAEFDRDVEIRFNADRLSGGAWLVTPNGTNADAGVFATLIARGTIAACVRVRRAVLIAEGLVQVAECPREASLIDVPFAYSEGFEEGAVLGAVKWIRTFVKPEYLA